MVSPALREGFPRAGSGEPEGGIGHWVIPPCPPCLPCPPCPPCPPLPHHTLCNRGNSCSNFNNASTRASVEG
jgi:hypothetical protein